MIRINRNSSKSSCGSSLSMHAYHVEARQLNSIRYSITHTYSPFIIQRTVLINIHLNENLFKNMND